MSQTITSQLWKLLRSSETRIRFSERTKIKDLGESKARPKKQRITSLGGINNFSRLLFGHLMQSTDSLEKTLMLGKIEGRRRRGWQRMRWWIASPTQWTWVWASSGSWWWTGKPGVLQSMVSQRVRHDWPTELSLLFILKSSVLHYRDQKHIYWFLHYITF